MNFKRCECEIRNDEKICQRCECEYGTTKNVKDVNVNTEHDEKICQRCECEYGNDEKYQVDCRDANTERRKDLRTRCYKRCRNKSPVRQYLDIQKSTHLES